MSEDKNPLKLTKYEILLKGTVIAVIITVPSLTVFALTWVISNDLVFAVILGVIIHFISMGFSLKISKKLLVKK